MTPDSLVPLLRGITIADDATGEHVYATTDVLMTLRNLVDYQLAMHAAALDRLGVAQRSGGKTRNLLISMGAAPSVAARWLRIGTALTELERVAAYAGDGVFSGEHVDALVRGMAHIEQRAPQRLSPASRIEHELALIAQAISGARPREVADTARSIGNQIAADGDGVPSAEDRSINELSTTVCDDGRLEVRGNLDIVIGEKLVAAIESLSTTRPEPDGSADARSPGQRRADALEQILDAAGRVTEFGIADLVAAPKTHVNVTVPDNAPVRASLDWLGPVSGAAVTTLACDAGVTEIVLDDNQAPLAVGRERRLFTPYQRKAIVARDRCCVKCGVAAGYTQCHHIVYWSNGGDTDVDNGCLLCTSCHAQIHNSGWDIMMGHDRHPWLIPPVEVDPIRTPLPAYNRRTMTLVAA